MLRDDALLDSRSTVRATVFELKLGKVEIEPLLRMVEGVVCRGESTYEQMSMYFTTVACLLKLIPAPVL